MEEETEEENELNIARRTRSHVKIDDSVLNDNLDLPDVDMNLYQNPGSERVDQDYNNFLTTLYRDELGQDTNNTDDNDTEYIYNNDIYSHGWTFDLNEVQEFKAHETSIETSNLIEIRNTTANALTPVEEAHSQPRTFWRGGDAFADPEFSRILNQQLRQHIQLLTQTYILTKNAANLRSASEDAKSHLQSYLKIFKDRTKPSNLLPALDLVTNYHPREPLKPSVRFTWRHLPLPDSIKKTIRDHPNIFIYSSLLPEVSYSFLERPKTKPEKVAPTKDTFTLNEDKLLTYALHEFRGETSKYDLISTLLMTTKTKKQIINHVKNIKRSSATNNPIKLYFEKEELPVIDQKTDSAICDNIKIEENLDDDTRQEEEEDDDDEVEEQKVESIAKQECDGEEEEKQVEAEAHTEQIQTDEVPPQAPAAEQDYCCDDDPPTDYQQQLAVTMLADINMDQEICERNQECDNIMDMDLDDLVAASSTISKPTYSNNTVNNSENKYIRNLKLRKSMLNLMSHNFIFSDNMGSLIIDGFLSSAKQKLNERQYLHLLQLLADLGKKKDVELIYQEVINFLVKIEAPQEFHERVVLFLDLEQAIRCGCAMSYLHWMRFFEFMQHMELYHDGVEVLEKKLVRLVDALQKDDSHKIKLAVANLINKHPFLKREFEALCLDEKPHQSLFICEEDFDDITEPLSHYESRKDEQISPLTSASNLQATTTDDIYKFEHFSTKVSKEEMSFASQHCPCKCHTETTTDGQSTQHCGRCNLKFMRGRMYLVNKIKPILAEWSYVEPTEDQWTFEEDRDILEFCRLKAEKSEETVSFDTQTFEELANGGSTKKSAREIAKRFNDLMDIYKDSIGGHQ